MNFSEIYQRLRDDSSVSLAITKEKEHLIVSVRIDNLPTQTVKATPEELNTHFSEFLLDGISASIEVKDFNKRWDEAKAAEMAKTKNKSSSSGASGAPRKQTKGEKLMDEANKLFNANQFSAAYTVFKEVLKTDYPQKSMAESKMRTCEQRMGIGGMFAEAPAPLSPDLEAIVNNDEEADSNKEESCSECGADEDVDPETGLCVNCSKELNP